MAIALSVGALSLALPCRAATAEKAVNSAKTTKGEVTPKTVPGAKVATTAKSDDPEFAAEQTQAKKVFKEDVDTFIKDYCAKCHGVKRQKSGLNLESALKNPGNSAAISKWKLAIGSVKTHDMPPDDESKQPTEQERQRFMEGIKQIKYLSPKDPGTFVIRRLTKMEYGNTLRDLFGVNPSIANDLPDEVFGEGYLNSLSPLQSEQFLNVANEVIDKVVAPEGKPPTEVQKRLFGSTPSRKSAERSEARKVATLLARNAYRRPATEAELDVLVQVFDLARLNKLSYQGSLGLMLKAVLVSPQFLFITPAGEVDAKDKIVRLDDYQLASRLSYLLWATTPDAELSSLADTGKLHEPAVLKAEVKRMLLDPRARALFDGFGAHWLGLGELDEKTFDTAKFPQMTPAMRTAMYDEARMFFESIVRENRSLLSFVDSDYTYLNETIAVLYGMEKQVTGPEMRKVTLTDANRGGILGMPGVLATTSFPNRTSPVKRGVWVLEEVLGEHVPPAPADVPSLEKQDQKAVAKMTLRQRTELHRKNPTCANCHRILDPIGFGLENFDAIGRWRDKDDSGGAIDAAGELPGGKRFSTPKELKSFISSRKDDVARNLTTKLLAYALCRQLEGYDEVVVDQVLKATAKDGYRMQTLITEIVTSYPFTQRRIQ